MNSSGAGRESRRFFAITSLGKSRWYWVVWPSLAEIQTVTKPLSHVAEGVEETKADAVEKALDVAGRNATWIAAKFAKAYHQNIKAGRTPSGSHPRDTGPGNTPVLHEYLYRDIYDAAARQWTSMPHRIVRRTSNYIYVEQQPYSPGDSTGSWLDQESPTYRLDRQTLKQQGYAFISPTAPLTDQQEPVFFVSERNQWHSSQVPACLQILHLSWPCTVKEVQEAYRKLVKSAHPDGGGSPDQFVALQAAYEQALRLCQ